MRLKFTSKINNKRHLVYARSRHPSLKAERDQNQSRIVENRITPINQARDHGCVADCRLIQCGRQAEFRSFSSVENVSGFPPGTVNATIGPVAQKVQLLQGSLTAMPLFPLSRDICSGIE